MQQIFTDINNQLFFLFICVVPYVIPQANLGLIIGFAVIVTVFLSSVMYIFLKKRGSQLIPKKLTHFENPVFFSHESKPDVVEPTTITESEETENTEQPSIIQI